MKTAEKYPESGAQLSYDTTFGLGEYFLSTLTLKNIFLEEKIVFPILFMIHRTKRMARHKEFFQLAEKIFNLTNKL